jgi:hypothetical protein
MFVNVDGLFCGVIGNVHASYCTNNNINGQRVFVNICPRIPALGRVPRQPWSLSWGSSVSNSTQNFPHYDKICTLQKLMVCLCHQEFWQFITVKHALLRGKNQTLINSSRSTEYAHSSFSPATYVFLLQNLVAIRPESVHHHVKLNTYLESCQ